MQRAVRIGHVALHSGLASFREFRAAKLHTPCLGSGEGRFGPRCNHGPLFLGKRSEQMQNERVNIRAKLGDKERDAMDHKAGNEMHVAAEPVCRTRAALRLTSECGRCTFSVAQMWTNLAEPAEIARRAPLSVADDEDDWRT